MYSDIAIELKSVSKRYSIYDKPKDRLLQMLYRNRKKFYKEFWALKDITFTIHKGETVGIIGRNGSGKSTLLQLICGIGKTTTGAINTNGRIAALLELGAGFNPEFTGLDNILLNGAILGIPHQELVTRIDDIIAFSELQDFINQPVKTYSSGMQARLAFSVAINVDPEILIVDEALAVGDARFVAKCMRRIKDIQRQGATVLFVSHDVSSVRTLCDRAIWLDKGKLVKDGDVFPVTGYFMEYMLDDKDIDAIKEETQPTNQLSEKNNEVAFDEKPLTHWGSNIGCIKSAGIYTNEGNRSDLFYLHDEVEVRICFKLPENTNKENLAVSFSIKDLKGSDLIVSSTTKWDKHCDDHKGEYYMVSYKFKYPLVTGRYLLVATIEDRSSPTIHYYEYLEGAHYFSSLTNERLFGIFQPEIEQKVVKINDEY